MFKNGSSANPDEEWFKTVALLDEFTKQFIPSAKEGGKGRWCSLYKGRCNVFA